MWCQPKCQLLFVCIEPTMALAMKRRTSQELKTPEHTFTLPPVLFPKPDQKTKSGFRQFISVKLLLYSFTTKCYNTGCFVNCTAWYDFKYNSLYPILNTIKNMNKPIIPKPVKAQLFLKHMKILLP